MIIHVCPKCLTYSGDCIEILHVNEDERIKEQELKETIHCTKCGWVGTWETMKKENI